MEAELNSIGNRSVGRAAAIVASVWLAGAGLGHAQEGADADEQPDFSGVWRNYRGPSIGGGQRSLWPEDAPYTDEARRRIEEYQALVEGTGSTPGGFCVGTGMPGSMLGSGGYPMEIIQRPEQVTIVYEAHNEIRRVYTDGREVDPRDLFPTRNGYSTGYWDGDTLIVETTALKEAVDQRSPHSEDATIVERYRLAGESDDGRRLLTAELTLTDPQFYEEPVTVTKTWVEAEEGTEMLTYECTEPEWEEYLEQRREQVRTRASG
ncbi:MAG: hypothetical protein JXB36_17040 [Gammaproteobacteria bacterium]|nr:hypothetical protein [Gammaproteobacteria bacterium]